MKLVSVNRKSKLENRYHRNMGRICVQVTRIRKHFLGIPYKTVHKYRQTYGGEVKDCEDCVISKNELSFQ
ncbi:hypothetical protein DXU93_10060 [Brumimicrobium aurantiacum]|uniref:Uncharacterized protein n=2 Tax=Brumimicrobium aurantiacum TaxID=1737063 RepID=A0A3E1EWL5_9FLAO|nr:hypothetical protein DXU93_10060 [Brumimicrobium aurantiacum]